MYNRFFSETPREDSLVRFEKLGRAEDREEAKKEGSSSLLCEVNVAIITNSRNKREEQLRLMMAREEYNDQTVPLSLRF